MKKGYKRLIIFSFILILLLLINIFCINILSSYGIILLLLILIPIFELFFVFEKDHHRYTKEILFEIIIYVISFFLLYYILGFVTGLARTHNYFTVEGIKTILLPIIIYSILRELFRYNMLCKADGSKITTTTVIIVFILLDITNNLHYASLNTKYEILKLIALTVMPAIAKNISYSYVSKKSGYKPVIVFDLIITLYPYILPLIPNPNEYVASIIYLLVPIFFALKMYKFFHRKEDDFLPSKYYQRRLKGAIIPTLIVVGLVYLYSGYFRFYAIAIASGSMSPKIQKGDIVIVDRSSKKDDYKEGQVIAYWKNNVIVVHRIVKKVKLNQTYIYYTKGDANQNIDDFVIEKNMIIGKVKQKISYIGYPTVWFSER